MSGTVDESRVAYRTCPLCEATCGLELTIADGRVTRIRGDRDDVFSKGFVCPKGSSLRQLDADPNRLRTPLIRRNGRLVACTWDEAFDHIAARLQPLLAEHGPDAIAVYLGNPNVHNMSGPIYNRVLLKALGTKNIFSASTVDQMPKHVSSGLMFGHPDTIAVPDLDRTDYLLILGANPKVSNGSLATAPDWPGRIDGIARRGGRVVVVDPRFSETAAIASEHIPITPGTDAQWLAALGNVIVNEGLVNLGRLADHCAGLDEAAAALTPFTPEAVSATCGIPAEITRRIALEFAAASTAVAYGRIGTHTTRFGTVAAWLVDLLNAVTGNLDTPGGAMFPKAATERPRSIRGFRTGRWASRVEGHPEVRGELPAATLASEIETAGLGQVRGLVTIAGNPVLSTPRGDQLRRALQTLDFMVSIDVYRNETTTNADVILPAPSPLYRSHYDLAFTALSVRNIANYSPPVFEMAEGDLDEWEIMLRLGAIAMGMPATTDVSALDDQVLETLIQGSVNDERSPITGLTVGEVVTEVQGERGPDRILDFLIRTGPYGDGFGTKPGLNLAELIANPHGIDLGPLQPRIPEVLTTPSGRVELAPLQIVQAMEEMQARLAEPLPGMLLVGRRTLRSNNSWMHNLEILVKGKPRCTLQINPVDASRIGAVEGQPVTVTAAAGSVTAPATITDIIKVGVVSLPHGWGHDIADGGLEVAARRPGVNVNELSPNDVVDPLSGNATLTAIPVRLSV
jgi:anaerobic selenocysteine-containing dehydrogenase